MKMDFNAPKPYVTPQFDDKDLVPLDPVLAQRMRRPIMAGAVLSALPVVVLYFVAQRWMVHGVTTGSVKG